MKSEIMDSNAVQFQPLNNLAGEAIKMDHFDPKSNLNAEQLNRLETMKSELSPFLVEDWEADWCNEKCLLRYLRARNWDTKKALEMIKATILWRRQVRPDCITAQDVDIELNNTGKVYRGGYDNQRRPIVYLKPGRDNTDDKVKDLKLLHFIYVMEKASRAAEVAPMGEKIIWIVDWKDQKQGGGLSPMNSIKMAREVVGILQNHYPERLGAAFIFNSPIVWHAFWKMISPFIDETTKSKIHMVKDVKKNNPIIGMVEPNQLEKDYGGASDYQYNYERDRLKEDIAFPPSRRSRSHSI